MSVNVQDLKVLFGIEKLQIQTVVHSPLLERSDDLRILIDLRQNLDHLYFSTKVPDTTTFPEDEVNYSRVREDSRWGQVCEIGVTMSLSCDFRHLEKHMLSHITLFKEKPGEPLTEVRPCVPWMKCKRTCSTDADMFLL